MRWRICLWCCALILCWGCQRGQQQAANDNGTGTNGAEKMTINLTSSAFAEGQMIPAKFTCSGENVSPPLAWANVPTDAKSLALVVDDPDAPRGTWVHWVAYNLPATTKELSEGIPAQE